MSYEPTHLMQLGHLKELADRTKKELKTLKDKVDTLVNTGGEPNVIEQIKVNGTAQKVTDRAVDITVPTAVSELNNDSEFQNATQVSTAIQAAIAATGHATFEKAESIPDPSTAKENVLYLVMNDKTHHYDIYAKVGEEVVLLDDTTVDLSEYSKTSAITEMLGNYVKKDGDKKLSTEDYTTDEKNKLAGIDDHANNYTHPTSAKGGSKVSGLYKIATDADGHVSDAVEVEKQDIVDLGIPETNTTYDEATQSEPGLMSAADKKKLDGMEIATDEEVQEMLDEVFPPEA